MENTPPTQFVIYPIEIGLSELLVYGPDIHGWDLYERKSRKPSLLTKRLGYIVKENERTVDISIFGSYSPQSDFSGSKGSKSSCYTQRSKDQIQRITTEEAITLLEKHSSLLEKKITEGEDCFTHARRQFIIDAVIDSLTGKSAQSFEQLKENPPEPNSHFYYICANYLNGGRGASAKTFQITPQLSEREVISLVEREMGKWYKLKEKYDQFKYDPFYRKMDPDNARLKTAEQDYYGCLWTRSKLQGCFERSGFMFNYPSSFNVYKIPPRMIGSVGNTVKKLQLNDEEIMSIKSFSCLED